MSEQHWETRKMLNRPGQEGGEWYADVLVKGPPPARSAPGDCQCALCARRRATPTP